MDLTIIQRLAFYVSVVIAVVFAVEAIYLAIATPLARKSGVNRRLKVLQLGQAGEQALNLLRAERGIDYHLGGTTGYLKRLLMQTGWRITVSRFLLIQLASVAALFLALTFLARLPQHYGLPVSVAAGLLLPLQIARLARSSRMKAFENQLPDALDIIVRSLRSGHPVPVAFAMVGKEMADPIGSEFGMTNDEMTYGLDMPQAMRNLSERVGLSDLALLVTAVSLQATSGGNLAEVLSNLSHILRERFQLRRKVRSLSAEGRYSAYGLFILPAAIAGVIYVQNPPYYTDVWNEPAFLPVMGGLIAWSLLGDVIMYKLINFKY